MKVLCVCSAGNSRSVSTAMVLKQRGYDALAVGVDANKLETVSMLCEWADVILIAQPHMQSSINPSYHQKINEGFTIGDDKWSNPVHAELVMLVSRELNNIGLV